MPLHVLPNRRLREGVQAHPPALAIGRYRPELFLTKDRDDPVHVEPLPGEDPRILNAYDRYPKRYVLCHKRLSHTHHYI